MCGRIMLILIEFWSRFFVVEDEYEFVHMLRMYNQNRFQMGTTFSKCGRGRDISLLLLTSQTTSLENNSSPDSDGLRIHHVYENCEQMEHRFDRPHDLLPRGGGAHRLAPRSPRQVGTRDRSSNKIQTRIKIGLNSPQKSHTFSHIFRSGSSHGV